MDGLRYENPVKAKLKNGQKTAGAFLQLAHSIPAEIFARAGFDWLIIDMEHAPGDQATLLGQLQAMNGTGTVPFVRVPWNDEVAIKKVLDLGARVSSYLMSTPATKPGRRSRRASIRPRACVALRAAPGLRAMARIPRRTFPGQTEKLS